MAQAIQTTTIMSCDEALRWLTARVENGRPLEATARELAREFGWPDTEAGRVAVGRHLARWENQGHISRYVIQGSRSVICRSDRTPDDIEIVHPVSPTVFTPEPAARPSVRPRVHLGVHHLFAVALAALALVAAACGLRISSQYGASLGRTAEAASTFAWLSFMAAAAAFVLPTAAQALWRGHRGVTAAVAWALAGLVLTVELLAAIGFYATNIADTTAARGKVAGETATLTTQIARLTADRAVIAEARSVASLDAAIAAAQGAAAAVWSRTAGCTDITRPASSEACTTFLRLREARGEAARRDAIDGDLRSAQGSLAALPAVASADPQAETAAAFATWVSRGTFAITANDIAMIRIGGMTALPQIAGLLFMLAASLWGIGREER